MSGLNHVEGGGTPLVLVLPGGATLIKVSVGPMDNNAYLLLPPVGPGILIDAANDAHRLVALTAAYDVDTIVTTHRHHDHWQALAAVAASTGARLVAGQPDVAAIAAGAGVSRIEPVWTGDTLPFGDETLEIIGLVGHTPGSITVGYRAGDGVHHLFTGDSLFPGGPGRTWSPEDFESLMDDLEREIFARFDDDTIIHPGHGDDTTLGRERPQLAGWRARGW